VTTSNPLPQNVLVSDSSHPMGRFRSDFFKVFLDVSFLSIKYFVPLVKPVVLLLERRWFWKSISEFVESRE
jgi:hypothetical protein